MAASSLSSLSSLAAGSSNSMAAAINSGEIYNEAVSLGLPKSESLKQQLECHAWGSEVKPTGWSLETGKPALTSTQEQVLWFRNHPYFP